MLSFHDEILLLKNQQFKQLAKDGRSLLKMINHLIKHGVNLNSTVDPMQWHMLSRANKTQKTCKG
jgi:hypothetical protein